MLATSLNSIKHLAVVSVFVATTNGMVALAQSTSIEDIISDAESSVESIISQQEKIVDKAAEENTAKSTNSLVLPKNADPNFVVTGEVDRRRRAIIELDGEIFYGPNWSPGLYVRDFWGEPGAFSKQETSARKYYDWDEPGAKAEFEARQAFIDRNRSKHPILSFYMYGGSMVNGTAQARCDATNFHLQMVFVQSYKFDQPVIVMVNRLVKKRGDGPRSKVPETFLGWLESMSPGSASVYMQNLETEGLHDPKNGGFNPSESSFLVAHMPNGEDRVISLWNDPADHDVNEILTVLTKTPYGRVMDDDRGVHAGDYFASIYKYRSAHFVLTLMRAYSDWGVSIRPAAHLEAELREIEKGKAVSIDFSNLLSSLNGSIMACTNTSSGWNAEYDPEAERTKRLAFQEAFRKWESEQPVQGPTCDDIWGILGPGVC